MKEVTRRITNIIKGIDSLVQDIEKNLRRIAAELKELNKDDEEEKK